MALSFDRRPDLERSNIMSFSSWLRALRPGRHNRPAGRSRAATRFRPRLEALEDRTVPAPAQVVPLTVTSLADSGPGTLRAAILSADAGSSSDTFTIGFAVTGTIDLASPLPDLNNNIAIQGPGASSLTLEPDALASFGSGIISMDHGKTASISGLTVLAGGVAGGIVNGGALTLSACTISGGRAWYLTATGYDGGGIANFGIMTVSGCTISGNSAFGPDLNMGMGGGIYNAGSMTLSYSTVSDNTSGGLAAGIFNDKTGNLKISNCVVRHNLTDHGSEVDIYNAGTLKFSGQNDIGTSYLNG
jgi:hypothetical protein